MNRRDVLIAGATLALGGGLSAQGKKTNISTNVYPWFTFFNREKKNWDANLEESIAQVAKAGLGGLEPSGASPDQIKGYFPILTKHDLKMKSIYVNSRLHDDDSSKSIDQVVAIAKKAQEFGCEIVVTNPEPIKWGSADNKTDAMLRAQAKNLTALGEKLAALKMKVAYHNHDIEMRLSAREFHHMMNGTDPKVVHLCLDAHWVYRGSGNSQVALFDAVKLYGKRIVELHLRQSKDGVWTEVFSEGDIDYARLVKELKTIEVSPLVVLEQAVEGKSPNTMTAVDAHAKSLKYAQGLFEAAH